MSERIDGKDIDFLVQAEQRPFVDEVLEHTANTSISHAAGKLALEQSVILKSDQMPADDLAVAEIPIAVQPIELNKRSRAYIEAIFGDVNDLDLREDDKLLLAQTLNGLRGKSTRSPLHDFTDQLHLLFSGLNDTEIGERVGKTRGSVVTGLSVLTKRIRDQPNYSQAIAYKLLAEKLVQRRNGGHVVSEIEQQQLHEPASIDEIELKGWCVAINELNPALFQERMRQLPQYLPPSTSETWIRIITDWLDGKGANELAIDYGLDEHAIGVQLKRASKIFLKERPASRTQHTLTSDDLEWQASALCAQTGGELFFPDKGETTLPAKKICAVCEVKKECKDYALRTDDLYGIWAAEANSARRRAANAKKLR